MASRGPHAVDSTLYQLASGMLRTGKPYSVVRSVQQYIMSQGGQVPPTVEHSGMPCDELLIGLLNLADEYPMKARSMDLSVLVALAVMCEDEIDHAIGENGHLMYAKPKQDYPGERLGERSEPSESFESSNELNESSSELNKSSDSPE